MTFEIADVKAVAGLEGQIRARLASALRSAERAVTVAVDKQHLSEAHVEAALHRLDELQSEVLTFISIGVAAAREPRP